MRSGGQIAAPPRSQNYGLVGTAFDYLLRFYVKYLNPHAIEAAWVAWCAVDLIQFVSSGNASLKQYVTDTLQQARQEYQNYLNTGNMTDTLIEMAIRLAQLDAIHRAGIVYHSLGKVCGEDVSDLRAYKPS